MRKTILPVFVVGALLLASCGDSGSDPTTAATKAGSTRPVSVNYLSGAPGSPGWIFDQPGAGPDGMSLHGTSGYTGDWRAKNTYVYATQNQGDRQGGLSIGVLDGTVRGCGTGRFVFFTPFVSYLAHGRWLVVAELGSADLADLGGNGESRRTGGDGIGWSKGVIRGVEACDGRGVPTPRAPFFGTHDARGVPVRAALTAAGSTSAWSGSLPAGPSVSAFGLSDGPLTGQLTGSWTGTATARIATVERDGPGRAAATGIALRFDGTVEGCGAGSFVLIALDRTVGDGQAASRIWEIAPGLGTGALADATGFGRGTPGIDGTSAFTGSMSCGA